MEKLLRRLRRLNQRAFEELMMMNNATTECGDLMTLAAEFRIASRQLQETLRMIEAMLRGEEARQSTARFQSDAN